VPMIRPLTIDRGVIRFENLLILFVTVLFSIFLFIGRSLSRIEGMILLLIYGFFISNIVFHFI